MEADVKTWIVSTEWKTKKDQLFLPHILLNLHGDFTRDHNRCSPFPRQLSCKDWFSYSLEFALRNAHKRDIKSRKSGLKNQYWKCMPGSRNHIGWLKLPVGYGMYFIHILILTLVHIFLFKSLHCIIHVTSFLLLFIERTVLHTRVDCSWFMRKLLPEAVDIQQTPFFHRLSSFYSFYSPTLDWLSPHPPRCHNGRFSLARVMRIDVPRSWIESRGLRKFQARLCYACSMIIPM